MHMASTLAVLVPELSVCLIVMSQPPPAAVRESSVMIASAPDSVKLRPMATLSAEHRLVVVQVSASSVVEQDEAGVAIPSPGAWTAGPEGPVMPRRPFKPLGP